MADQSKSRGRRVDYRLRLTGHLVARGPVHVGGVGGSVDVDMALAVDGAGEYYIPGVSLAGALRNLRALPCDTRKLWGSAPTKGSGGKGEHASQVYVEDASVTVPEGLNAEIREGVGIERRNGTAAAHYKYNRAVLPRGSQIRLEIMIETTCAQKDLAQRLIGVMAARLQNHGMRLGASKTRGLGHVILQDARLEEQAVDSPEGIIAFLGGGGWTDAAESVQAAHPAGRDSEELSLCIGWRPDGPVMVKAEGAGVAVDMLPLVSGTGDGLVMVMPGSSIKGALRAQAERIYRTVTGLRAPAIPDNPREEFRKQMEQIPLIEAIFGAARKAEGKTGGGEGGKGTGELAPGVGALSVDDCYATNQPCSPGSWSEVEDAGTSDQLRAALVKAHLPQAQQAFHVAIDRWTGGAADSALYSALEPFGVAWENIGISVDLHRLYGPDPNDVAKRRGDAALCLLLLTLRDLGDGRAPLGFGVNRGMGSIIVDEVTIKGAGENLELSALNGILAGGNPAGLDAGLKKRLVEAWLGVIADGPQPGQEGAV